MPKQATESKAANSWPADNQTVDAAAAKAAIRAKALAIGFDLVGFAPAEIGKQPREALAEYLRRGHHGDMAWMADTFERRASPQGLWPDTRSVVVLGLNYGPKGDALALLERPERANISVYARNRDYHDTVKKRLKVLARWMVETFPCEVKVFVDTAPVLEKELAARSGIGWRGKHSVVLSREFGNWLVLGEVYTTLELPPDAPEKDHCGSCSACMTACPTDAFDGPYKVDARRCISYLTIEHKGHIDEEFRAPMGNRVYGCDDCLAVCPWNKFAQQSLEADFMPRVELTLPRLTDLAELDDAGFRQVFSTSPVKRVGRDRFLRNVLIALGNCGDPGVLPTVRRRLDDDSPLVRAMAIWALGRLAAPAEFARERAARLPGESDQEVAREWS